MTNEEVPCSTHPDAPHGFNRTSSHTLDRYVCDCEGWVAPAVEGISKGEGLEVVAWAAWRKATNSYHTIDGSELYVKRVYGEISEAKKAFEIHELVRLSDAMAIIDKQAARIAELQKDADRYRHLKATADTGLMVELEDHVFVSRWDEAIDAAMGSKGHE